MLQAHVHPWSRMSPESRQKPRAAPALCFHIPVPRDSQTDPLLAHWLDVVDTISIHSCPETTSHTHGYFPSCPAS